jgi:tRNA(Arg) A34 adenosine deaminase TadA
MTDLTPGVRPAFRSISTAEDAASLAVILAEESLTQGSFGVGGFLVDRSGHLLAEATNAVIKDRLTQDPTAHVERQLIDWYFEARRSHLGIPTNELVIVTSVDPCAMCAGAILRSGIKAVALTEDPISGISEDGMPHRMPKELWYRAENHFAFFGISGCRPRSGVDLGPLFAGTVSSKTLLRAERAFSTSLDDVRNLVGEGNLSSHKAVFELVGQDFSTLKFAPPEGAQMVLGNLNVTLPSDRAEVMKLLAHNASLITDCRGRVIMCSAGAEDQSPVRSSVLELIRAYVKVRLLAAKHGVELPHQRHCSIVKRHPPSAPDQALLELGAVGSFLEMRHSSSRIPALAYLEWNDISDIERWAASLPPLYTTIIGVRVGRIPDNVLRLHLWN